MLSASSVQGLGSVETPMKSYARSVSGRWRSAALFHLVYCVTICCVGGVKFDQPANCTSPCIGPVEYTRCTTDECLSDVPHNCPDGYISARPPDTVPDPDKCFETGCSTGGCPEGTLELSSEFCATTHFSECKTLVCKKETCCESMLRHPKCCRALLCTPIWAECEVPQQGSLSDPSHSLIGSTILAHNGNATFPFFTHTQVLPGESCDSKRVWGQCTCVDGKLQPGCKVTDSSTWLALGHNRTLPANLSLTCVEQSAPPRPPPDASATLHGGGSSSREQQQGLTGVALAAVIMGALAVVMLVGMGTWYGCSRAARRKLRQMALGNAYEPVQTGQAYQPTTAPPLGKPHSPHWKRPFGTLQDAFSNFRHTSLKRSPAAPRFSLFNFRRGGAASSAAGASSSGGGAFGQRSAGGYSGMPAGGDLPVPALPEDDEVFTLEDLEEPHHDHYPTLPVSHKAEVELYSYDPTPLHGAYGWTQQQQQQQRAAHTPSPTAPDAPVPAAAAATTSGFAAAGKGAASAFGAAGKGVSYARAPLLDEEEVRAVRFAGSAGVHHAGGLAQDNMITTHELPLFSDEEESGGNSKVRGRSAGGSRGHTREVEAEEEGGDERRGLMGGTPKAQDRDRDRPWLQKGRYDE